MAELLVLAKAGYTNPDADHDRIGCYKKGDVVVAFESGHVWGAAEGLPDFVIVKIPTLTLAQVEAYRDSWNFELAFTTITSDLAQDGFRIEISNSLPGALKQAAVTRDQIEHFINSWGGTVQTVAVNAIRFDIRIYTALTSEAFWGRTDIPFSEVAYDQGTGVHRIRGDYNLLPRASSAMAAAAVTGHGGTVVSNSGGVIVFDMERSLVRDAFQSDLYAKARAVFKRRRFGFTAAAVDSAIAAGGSVTRTPAQVQAALIDAVLQ